MPLRALVLLLVAVLALQGCGDADPGPAAEPAPDPEPVEAAPTPAEEAPPAAGDVAVGTTALGEVLVDADGMTLYMFEPDEQSESTCYDDCATSWPPVVIDGEPQAGDGIEVSLLGTVARDDGATQVTYDGWPLYRWAGDSASGETNGQGVNDVWWVLAPDGTPLREDASAATDY